MGIYLNPGKLSYQTAINSEIFVDKTEMIQCLNRVVNTNQKYVCVSRPRRFGKTIAANMISAYYGREADGRSMFEKRKLANCAPMLLGDREVRWDAYLGKFDVIRVVMTDFIGEGESVESIIEYLTDEVSTELMDAYPDLHCGMRINLRMVMNKIYGKTGRQFVIILDEWDALFRIRSEDKEGQTKYLDFLRNWLKDKDYVALAYMTGILPIKKYGEHSALNMFTEYSMMAPRQMAPFTGFTENEVKELCNRYGRDYGAIKEWYDGYLVSDNVPPDANIEYQKSAEKSMMNRYFLYSPLSVVEAMITGRIGNYWNKTETYEALAKYIRMDYDGLRDAVVLLMDGGRLRVDTSTYQNDMTTLAGRDDVLSLLVHLGYLGFDDETSEVFVPNKEILDEFKASTKTKEWETTFKSFAMSQKLLKATWEVDEDKVAELLEEFHNQVDNRTYNDEAALSYAVQLAYYAAHKYYTTILEMDTGKGYADIVYLPSPKHPEKPALLVELKYNADTDTALSQIKRQKYPERLEHYRGNLLLIALNYDKDASSKSQQFKRHTCKIERA